MCECNNLYLVPDYYVNFRCKAGCCRTVCCEGWPVTFSMTDYFKLLGTDCSPELKRRLDGALHLTDQPTEDEYGMLLPRWDGQCAMRREDGLCALQVEAGEDALPTVCRQYPRSISPGECCCSNSCEAVIELLDRKEPLQFQTIHQDFNVKPLQRIHFFETGGREMEIRLWLIGFVQEGSLPLGQRLGKLRAAVHSMDEALASHDFHAVNDLLSGKSAICAPELQGSRQLALDMVQRILEQLDRLCDGIRDYGQAALLHFAREGEVSEESVSRRLFQASPNWEMWFENMLVNHMFFSRFPFQDRPVSLKDETIALYSVYALLRFLTIGAGDGTRQRMADIASALFRLVDHTAFDRYTIPIIRQFYGDECAMALLTL